MEIEAGGMVQNRMINFSIEHFVLGKVVVVMNMYKRIRDLREDRDWTQAYVGEQINVPQRTYSYYETGKRLIPPNVLVALADLYNVSVDYLLDRTDNPRRL